MDHRNFLSCFGERSNNNASHVACGSSFAIAPCSSVFLATCEKQSTRLGEDKEALQ
jgi:hypothetical protein